MSILVTGGAGFIGSHLIELLLNETDADIVILDNFNDFYDPALKRDNAARFSNQSRVWLEEADFCDLAENVRIFTEHSVKHVVHLGAHAGVRPSVAAPAAYVKNNVGGTLAMLEAARRCPVDRFLLVSSSTVYGNGVQIPFCEDAPLGTPASPYGVSKGAAELMGLSYAGLHGVPVVCLRPFSVYGPRLRPDLALSIFARAIHEDQEISLYGDGTIRRDFTHVSDICAGLLAALTAENVVGQEINLGHSSPIEMRELIERLEAAFGKQANVKRFAGRPEDLPITFADLTKAKQLLGYEPQVSFDDGIPEYVAWFKSWYGGTESTHHDSGLATTLMS
jgi:UDP-glucuronate 4-epimerase